MIDTAPQTIEPQRHEIVSTLMILQPCVVVLNIPIEQPFNDACEVLTARSVFDAEQLLRRVADSLLPERPVALIVADSDHDGLNTWLLIAYLAMHVAQKALHPIAFFSHGTLALHQRIVPDIQPYTSGCEVIAYLEAMPIDRPVVTNAMVHAASAYSVLRSGCGAIIGQQPSSSSAVWSRHDVQRLLSVITGTRQSEDLDSMIRQAGGLAQIKRYLHTVSTAWPESERSILQMLLAGASRKLIAYDVTCKPDTLAKQINRKIVPRVLEALRTMP